MLYEQKGELQVCTPDMSTEKMNNERKISMQKQMQHLSTH